MSSGDVISAIEGAQERAFQYGDTAIQQAFNYAQQAVLASNDAQYISPIGGIAYPSKPDMQSPFNVNMIPGISATLNPYGDEWIKKFDKIINEFFEELLSFGLAEKKLEDILQNGFLTNINLHNQIINRTRDDAYTQFIIDKDNIINEYTSKGFSIPSGILNKKIEKLQEQMNDNINKVSRDLAIKEEEVNVDMIKFSIQQALALKPQIIGIASDFASKYGQMYNFGAENARTYLQGLGVINDSVNQYERNLISLYDIGVKDIEFRQDLKFKDETQKVNTALERAKIRAQTALGAADAVARIGASSVSAQTTIAQLGASTVE